MARIVIDRIIGISGSVEGEIVIHTDLAPWNRTENPLVPGTQINVIAFLAICKTNPAVRTAAGYDLPSHIPGKSRFQVLLDAGI